MTFTHIFFLQQKFAYATVLGEHKQYFWGAQASKCTLVASGLLLYFGAQSSLGEHNSRLQGEPQALIWGGLRPKIPPWHQAYTLHLCKPRSDAIIQESASKSITL